MSILDMATQAGFYVNNGEIFSPYTREKITNEIQEFLDLVEKEVLDGISNEREPSNLNYSTNNTYTYNVQSTFRSIEK